MYPKNNRLLFFTCVQIITFGAFACVPAYAEFKWTPPEDSGVIEDVGPDVFIVKDTSMPKENNAENIISEHHSKKSSKNFVPPIEKQYFVETQNESINSVSEINNAYPVSESDNQTSSLVLNPYPLENENIDQDQTVNYGEDDNKDKNENIASYDVIEGFGVDMPMALALRQIVPAEYAYSFNSEINLGALLSWEGGKPWDEVLDDALTPLGVKALIHSKKVFLSNIEKNESAESAKENDIIASPAAVTTPPEEAINLSLKEKTKEKTKENKTILGDIFVLNAASNVNIVKKTGNISEDNSKNNAATEVKLNTDAQDILAAPVLNKNISSAGNEKTSQSEEKDVSSLIDDLISPLDNFKNKQTEQVSPLSDDKKYTTNTIVETLFEPAIKPEILLSEEAKAKAKTEERHIISFSEGIENLDKPVDMKPEEKGFAVDIKSSPVLQEELPLHVGMNAKDNDNVSEINDSQKSDNAIPNKFRKKPSEKIRIWQAKSNSHLQKVIEEWSRLEGIALSWDITEKYVLDYDVFISGTYKNAIGILFKKGLKRAPKYVLSEEPYNISVQEDG